MPPFYFIFEKLSLNTMEKVSKYTKWKVVSGYSVLFLLSLLFAILIFKQITNLIVNEGTNGTASEKLFIIGNITTGLYEAEALSNAFIQTGSQRSFQRYMVIMEETEMNIDSLKTLTLRMEQQLRIDSISLLLEEKVRNVKDLVWIKRKLEPGDFYSKAIANIELGKDSLRGQPNIRKRLVTTFDTSYVRSEKKKRRWLFSKNEPDSVLRISPNIHIVTDTLTTSAEFPSTDSVISILKSTWEDVQKEKQDINRQINKREYALIQQSTYITDQLKRILGEYEKEEITLSLQKQQNREQTMTNMIRIFAWVAVITILLVAFFTFFILRDLSRSQRYRRQLESANLYADQLLKSREKMILTITHDIKSPLSSVIGYIELLNNTPINERQSYFLKNMKGSSEHILQLVGNLLDLSKLENNKMPVEEIVFNPIQLFQEINDTFIPLTQAKHLKLESKFDETLAGEFIGDALRIRQIITNILSNAVKYTASGSVSFTATRIGEHEKILLEIKDTGSGMTADEQKIIFEEFTRLSSHSTIEGTGLGLTITLKLIHLLGGEIKLSSSPGQGSCFTILLPLAKAISGNTQPPQLPATAISAATPSSVKLKILLVDDDPLQLEMTAGLLANKGIQADRTTHPGEVIEKLSCESYDIIFSDIQMPELNGFELVKQIRKMPAPTGNIPVVALSADADKQDKDYLEAGFTAYLAKPFESGQLIRLINRLAAVCLPEDIQLPQRSETTGYTLHNIMQFTDNDPEALKSIITSFINTTREHLRLLRQYLEEKKWADIARLAHKMLPIFRQLETQELIDILQKLEHKGETSLSEEEMTAITVEVIEKAGDLIEKLKRNVYSME